MVYDDSHRAVSLGGDPRWRRWVPAEAGWTEPEAGTFRVSNTQENWAEFRYRHVVPDPEQWEAIRNGQELPVPPRPTLITDFSSYNTDLSRQGRLQRRSAARPWFQPHWVGDLTMSCRVTVRRGAGRFRLELIKGGVSNRCEIDLSTGQARLFHDQNELGEPVGTTLNSVGSHTVTLANVDERLTLWVDGVLPFGEGRVYDSSSMEKSGPTAADLEPARLACEAGELEVTDLVLKRDIYYTLHPSYPDHARLEELARMDPRAFFDLLADPGRFAALGSAPARDYLLGDGRYLMLGDNSPWSRDGRAWGRNDQVDPGNPNQGWDDTGRESWEVPESLIIGKAFCVYWPHLKPVWPMVRLGPDYRLPARPYLERMRWIR
jgi:signal peptidase I